jgi:FMN phosphatase YigB (HAD superfamily)
MEERKIKALSFDGNGVLYYRSKDFAAALVAFIRKSFIPALDVAAAEASHRVQMLRAFDGSIDKTEAMGAFLDDLRITDPKMRKAIMDKELEFSRSINLFPGEKETLVELDRRGFVLGMITNSYQSAQEKASWFLDLGLECIARNVVSSIDAGVSKPDPGIYLAFAEKVGFHPDEIVFVGHESFELEGAQKAGFLPISFNCAQEIRRDLHMDSFSDLLDIIPYPGYTPGIR